MATPAMEEHTRRYLTAASDLLAKTSPATAAHLRSIRHSSTGSDDADFCAACGNTMIPGRSCKTVREPVTRRKAIPKQVILSNAPKAKMLKLQCDQCKTITVRTSRKPTKTHTKSKQTAVQRSEILASQPAPESRPAVSAPVNSRKARSKNSNLQSLLAGQPSKANQANSTGLDLMDFMKT